MPNTFQNRFGGTLPTIRALQNVAFAATLTARGDPTFTPERLAHEVQQQSPTETADLRALNNQLLRAFVDGLVVGDPISNKSCLDLMGVSKATHWHYEPDGYYCFANLDGAKSPSLKALGAALRAIDTDPGNVAICLARSLRFSTFPPDDLLGEHPLIEDSLARAAVVAHTSSPRCIEAATTFAKLAFAFRSVPGEIIPRRPVSNEEIAKLEKALKDAAEIQEDIAPLLHLARRIEAHARLREQVDDSRLLTPLSTALNELFDTFSAREPCRPFSFFCRAETLKALHQLEAALIPAQFPYAAKMLEEFQAIELLLDQPGVGSVDGFGKALLMGVWCEGDPFISSRLLPDTHVLLRHFAKRYGIRLES